MKTIVKVLVLYLGLHLLLLNTASAQSCRTVIECYERAIDLLQLAQERVAELEARIIDLETQIVAEAERLDHVIANFFGPGEVKSINQTHQAVTDGIAIIRISGTGTGGTSGRLGISNAEGGFSDNAFPGVARVELNGIGSQMTLVRRGEYYRAWRHRGEAVVRLYWIPIGNQP